ncbi:hypothetical protein IC744_10490 [Microbacterium hominis]|uniref:hypothetical protein n=1 Tax=Microbacterium hominis TaxID=162426 RepID=UPI00168B8E2E|nr:hypothetical protein [Microbacterium hominis]QOC27893.1 hypothetical protein IC744_10490 [Microbacterium hominis]
MPPTCAFVTPSGRVSVADGTPAVHVQAVPSKTYASTWTVVQLAGTATASKPVKSVIVNGLLASSVAAPSVAAFGSWMTSWSTLTLEALEILSAMSEWAPGSNDWRDGVQVFRSSTPMFSGTSMLIVAELSTGLALVAVTAAVLTMSPLSPAG